MTALRLRDADRATAAMRTHLTRVSGHLLGSGYARPLLIAPRMERGSAGSL